MNYLDLKRNGKYNRKNSDEQLIFIEVKLESSGYWYHFDRVLDSKGGQVIVQQERLKDFEETVDEPAAEKCDGDHGGPKCADAECWNDDHERVRALEKAWVEVNSFPLGSLGYEKARKVFEPNYQNP